ncbi:MAG: NPCBM/NEW2 domain-containing protein [Pirellulales bacterium]
MSGRLASTRSLALPPLLALPLLFALPGLLTSPRTAQAQYQASLVEGTTLAARSIRVNSLGKVELAADPPRTLQFDDLLTIEFPAQPPSTPAEAAAWTLTTRDGGRLRVAQLTLQEEQFTLQAAWLTSPWTVSIDDVARGVRSASQVALADDDIRWRPVPAHDKLLLLEGKRIDAVAGFLLAMDDERLEFDVDGATRRIPLASTLAFVLASPEPPVSLPQPARDARPPASKPTPPRPVRLELHDGSLLHGHSFTCQEETVELAGVGEKRLAIRRSAVRSVECQSQRVVWLADLQPTDVVQSSQVAIPRDWQRNRSVFGGPLVIGERTYRRGIGLQAATRLRFDVPKHAQTFVLDVGLDAAAGGRGDCELVVAGDGGAPLVRRRLRGGEPAQRISVLVAGVRQLQVAVEPGAHFDLADQAVLGDARFLRPAVDDASPASSR